LKLGTVSRVIVERFETGDDILERLNELVQRNKVTAGSFTAIGAVRSANIGCFLGNGEYSTVSVEGPLEIVSCVGNISVKDGLPSVHAHIGLADKKGSMFGGHLMPGCMVGGTFEVTIHAFEAMSLIRKLDSKSGLYLLET
jgi:predicted DNA-binding protein with PD1-like motif